MKENQIAQYAGDSLRNLLLNYSKERMRRDGRYRAGVQEILSERRAAKKEEKEGTNGNG